MNNLLKIFFLGTSAIFVLPVSPLKADINISNQKIADASADLNIILKRINELENEVNSLKKLLKEKPEIVESEKEVNQKNNFYISSGLGLMNDPYMLDADRPNDDNKGLQVILINLN